MPFSGLSDFIAQLEKSGELTRIRTFVDPELEITEITDRVTKNGGKALLFENNGSQFPVLINAYGTDKRMAMALGTKDLDSISGEIITLFETFSGPSGSALNKFSSLKNIIRVSQWLPSKSKGRGKCQQVINRSPDLSVLPALKCWPYDGGRYITLPMVHTIHPLTGKPNVGMYRIQILGRNTTAMHWQRHKTGANHFEAWKSTGKKMPVTVALGGDPAYAYCATAPLPENIDEYILAGFLRKKRVKLVKCITNDLYIPSDADIVIEGYVDPAEELVLEGPFGDHTGFYSLADRYPLFHVTCITHSAHAIYPATIVGIPPQEDAWMAKASEKIFLAPVKLMIQPEIEDFHMPHAGVIHNLAIVRIAKSYPGQGKKVISSLLGTGQMMFTKYLVVTSGDIDIRNYSELLNYILKNSDFRTDILFSSGPLDVLDHSSDSFSYGGKLGIDGTIKHPEERESFGEPFNTGIPQPSETHEIPEKINKFISDSGGMLFIPDLSGQVMIISINQELHPSGLQGIRDLLTEALPESFRLILLVDNTVDIKDMNMVAWQILGNSDPGRDAISISERAILINGTMKAFGKVRFKRRWPNVVSSLPETIRKIDEKWELLGIGPFITSPSFKISRLIRNGKDQVVSGQA